LEGEHARLKSRFGYTEDLDHELRSLRDDISGLESTTEEVDGRVDEFDDRVEAAERTVKRLTQHVRLPEGQIMAVGNVPPADLDTFTKDQHALAATMESGWDAADALLTSTLRTHHQNRVQRFHNAQDQHQATRQEAVALVGTMLNTPYNTQAHAKAATKLRSVIARETTERQGLARQASEARKATEALAADRAATADKQPAIAADQRAEHRLTLALRSKLADAVSNRLLLPAWFATVLGPAPPARETERWLECATRVLLYRLTYRVDDQVLALGPRLTPRTNTATSGRRNCAPSSAAGEPGADEKRPRYPAGYE
jgi:chromosome segregation ATPase